MQIPSTYCEGLSEHSDLELASRFIHETIHAKFLSWVFDDFYNSETGSSEVLPNSAFESEGSIFTALAEANFSQEEIVSGNHHYLMFIYYLEVVQTSLWEMNGREGKIEDYLYYAHLIVNTQQMADNVTNPLALATHPWLANMGLENFDLESINNPFPNFEQILNFNADCIEE